MKKFLTIVLFINCFFSFAQKEKVKPASIDETKKYGGATINVPLDTLNHSTCLDKQFSVVFYIVLDSTNVNDPNYPGVGLASPANIAYLMAEMNLAFKPICVSFVNCSTVYIPNFNYGKSWLKNIMEPAVTAAYYTDKTLNIYLVDSVHAGFGNIEPEGYTYDPSPANLAAPKKDIIVIHKYKIIQLHSSPVNHLLGHYFGLPHTFDEINPGSPTNPPAPTGVSSLEFVNRTNCYTHGDGFCDTEADPGDNTIIRDGTGAFYLHPIDNFMSLYGPRSRFTQEQYNWMARIIMEKRLYLH